MMSKASEIDEEEFQKCLKKPIVKVSNIITCRFSLDSNLTYYLQYNLQQCLRLLKLTQYSDMPNEMGAEAVEVVTMALDKFVASRDWEQASVLIKNTLDKKFGPSWQCAVGEGFGFDIACQQKYLLHLYYGRVAILCYKSA